MPSAAIGSLLVALKAESVPTEPEQDVESRMRAAHLRNGTVADPAKPRPTNLLAWAPDDEICNAVLLDFDAEWRSSFQETFQDSGYRYEQLWPAYRYGGELAISRRFGELGWTDIEAAVHQDWEQRNPSTWEPARKAIRCAWQSVRERIMTPDDVTAQPA
jgi:hypothetical protein